MATLCYRAGHYIFILWFLSFFMAAVRCRGGHYVFVLWFLLSSIFYHLSFSSPILSRRRLDVYHTYTHGVALVQI